MNPNELHTIALSSLPAAPVRFTRRARRIALAVAFMTGALLVGPALRMFFAGTLAVGEWWTSTALPFLTLAAPVGIPFFAGSILFMIIVRVDRGR